MAVAAGAAIGAAVQLAGGLMSGGAAKRAANKAANSFIVGAREQLRRTKIKHRDIEGKSAIMQHTTGVDTRFGTARTFLLGMKREHKKQRDFFSTAMEAQYNEIQEGGNSAWAASVMGGVASGLNTISQSGVGGGGSSGGGGGATNNYYFGSA